MRVLFACVRNAGRSQMAAAYAAALSDGRVRVRSAGSAPAAEIDPVVVAALREDGVEPVGDGPAPLTREAVADADLVVTMGCGDACPVVPGVRTEDWPLPDPAGLPIEQVRPIRDEVRRRVEQLLDGL